MTDPGDLPDLAAFQDLLDRHGAEIDTWPAALREPALTLYRQDPAVRKLVAEAEALGALLKRAEVDPPDAALIARILSTAPTGPAARPNGRIAPWSRVMEALGLDVLGSGWRPAMTLASALIVGLSIGYVGDLDLWVPGRSPIAAEAIDSFALGLTGFEDFVNGSI